MDRFNALRTYVAVIEEGGFTGAANRLRIAKSAVSKHVQSLEDELGVRLLNRTTRQVNATEVGETYYAHARRILSDLEAADNSVQALNSEPRGPLKISAPMSFGIAHLSSAVAEFMGRYPDVKIELILDDHYVDLLEGNYDLAVRIGSLPNSSLKARKIAINQVKLVASPEYLKNQPPVSHPRDLKTHRILQYGLLTTGDVWTFKGPDGEQKVRVTPTMITNNGDVIMDAAIAGNGVCRLPTFILWQALKVGSLVEILPTYQVPETAIHVVYPPGKHLSPKVLAFIDYLIKFCGKRPYWDEGI